MTFTALLGKFPFLGKFLESNESKETPTRGKPRPSKPPAPATAGPDFAAIYRRAGIAQADGAEEALAILKPIAAGAGGKLDQQVLEAVTRTLHTSPEAIVRDARQKASVLLKAIDAESKRVQDLATAMDATIRDLERQRDDQLKDLDKVQKDERKLTDSYREEIRRLDEVQKLLGTHAR
jgi:hypothetical protein